MRKNYLLAASFCKIFFNEYLKAIIQRLLSNYHYQIKNTWVKKRILLVAG